MTMPIGGRLGDMFGKEHTLVFTMAGLAAGTLLAAFASPEVAFGVEAQVLGGLELAVAGSFGAELADEFAGGFELLDPVVGGV